MLRGCVKRTINGAVTLFTYDGWKPILEWNGAGALLAWNIYGSGPDESCGAIAALEPHLVITPIRGET